MLRLLTVLKSYERVPLELELTLVANVQRLAVKKNEIVQPYGSTVDCLYFVEKGLFHLFSTHSRGKQRTMHFKMEDDFIMPPIEHCLNGTADGIQALEEGVLWVLPGPLVSQLKKEYHPFAFQYTEIMTKVLAASNQALRCSRLGGPSNFDFLKQCLPHLLARVPIPYLASFMNIPERMLRHLIKSKLKLNFSTRRR